MLTILLMWTMHDTATAAYSLMTYEIIYVNCQRFVTALIFAGQYENV